MVAQQLEKAMRKNDNLKDVSEEILQALAARMEKVRGHVQAAVLPHSMPRC